MILTARSKVNQMTAFSSMNFTSKSELRRAVAAGLPVVLWAPIAGMPVITGQVRCQGPWESERGRSWKADVVVRDMRIVEVLR